VAEWAAYAGDRGSNLAACTILVVFFGFYFLYTSAQVSIPLIQ